MLSSSHVTTLCFWSNTSQSFTPSHPVYGCILGHPGQRPMGFTYWPIHLIWARISPWANPCSMEYVIRWAHVGWTHWPWTKATIGWWSIVVGSKLLNALRQRNWEGSARTP